MSAAASALSDSRLAYRIHISSTSVDADQLWSLIDSCVYALGSPRRCTCPISIALGKKRTLIYSALVQRSRRGGLIGRSLILPKDLPIEGDPVERYNLSGATLVGPAHAPEQFNPVTPGFNLGLSAPESPFGVANNTLGQAELDEAVDRLFLCKSHSRPPISPRTWVMFARASDQLRALIPSGGL